MIDKKKFPNKHDQHKIVENWAKIEIEKQESGMITTPKILQSSLKKKITKN